jgi:hypothetical protein
MNESLATRPWRSYHQLKAHPQPVLDAFASQRLAVGHFLGHVEQEPAVRFFDFAEQPAKTTQITRVFPSTAPGDVVRALPLGKVRKLGRLFAIVEHLVERHFHGASQLLQGLYGGNGVTVLDTRDVTAKQAGALFNVALGKFLCFTE